ncbi:hypothetical protein HG535_0A03470 [Zygotorulaspora mrakii]|uniref:SHSP domain-containing protein n=1 Tax=Zygotorulaspora mrakii TaxID=42260 RepID=A0A7H9AVL7_ZYGMR|nr:uncharacterized protein HG535_0A03470 [Zygotorulaspora mrakii]QLG70408.1 hypothetical protein HG535_0A03470 [Zygotorulaspora mrakii]
MSFNTPFYDFFDAINNEVNSFSRLLDNTGYNVYDSSARNAQLPSTDKQVTRAGKNNQITHSKAAPLTALDDWFENDWPLIPEAVGKSSFVPPVDILDHDKNYEVTVTAPGVKDKKDINLEYHKERNQIVVSGEIPSTFDDSTKDKLKVQERFSGKFKRIISLPDYPGIDADNIKADYSNGILTLTIPKLKPSKDGSGIQKIEIFSQESSNKK